MYDLWVYVASMFLEYKEVTLPATVYTVLAGLSLAGKRLAWVFPVIGVAIGGFFLYTILRRQKPTLDQVKDKEKAEAQLEHLLYNVAKSKKKDDVLTFANLEFHDDGNVRIVTPVWPPTTPKSERTPANCAHLRKEVPLTGNERYKLKLAVKNRLKEINEREIEAIRNAAAMGEPIPSDI